jgi:hypothetical protein
MLRRWLIRAVFMLPILLCVGGWGFSVQHGGWVSYAHSSRLVDFGTAWGTIDVTIALFPGEPDGLDWLAHPMDSFHFWPYVDQAYHPVFGFGFRRLVDTNPPNSDFYTLYVPYWFLIVVFSLILSFVWRKTRPRINPKWPSRYKSKAVSRRASDRGLIDRQRLLAAKVVHYAFVVTCLLVASFVCNSVAGGMMPPCCDVGSSVPCPCCRSCSAWWGHDWALLTFRVRLDRFRNPANTPLFAETMDNQMLLLPDHVLLHNLISDANDDALITDLTPAIAHIQIDQQWWVLPGVENALLEKEPDATWRKWAAIAAQAQDSSEFVCVGCITGSDKQVQGAMLYWTAGRSLLDPTLQAVNVLLLATAPRNRPVAGREKYRGVGSSLLLRAVAHSYLLGLKGRTVLQSKPTPQATQFYAGKRFRSHSAAADGKIDMELEPESALKWLRDEGLIK